MGFWGCGGSGLGLGASGFRAIERMLKKYAGFKELHAGSTFPYSAT